MNKCCGICKYCYCDDETAIDGFCCYKFKTFKITELDRIHPLCINEFKLSWFQLFFGGSNE